MANMDYFIDLLNLPISDIGRFIANHLDEDDRSDSPRASENPVCHMSPHAQNA